MDAVTKIIPFYGREIKLRIGTFAPQAGGSVLVQCGETAILVTATRGPARDGVDFVPLLVDYEERLYAAGRIPGGFLRREGRPPEKATLTCRLIDRPMRPLFPNWLRDDVQIVATTMAIDEKAPPDVLAVTGASIAALIAGLPFMGPMAGVRVGLVGDEFIINPTYAEVEAGDLDLVVAGTAEGIIMVEAGANQLPEADMIEAIDFGYEAVLELIKAQLDLLQELGLALPEIVNPVTDPTLENFIANTVKDKVAQVVASCEKDRNVRDAALDAIKAELLEAIAALPEEDPVKLVADKKVISATYKDLTKKLMRLQVIEQNVRIDGRKLDEVRPIWTEVSVIPRVHGSGLFNRGLTQVLTIATLGTPGDAQEMDDLHPDAKKRYMHHYNFPPYSVGEARPMRSAGRREIGHGALAERALLPVLPSKAEFPYVLRLVSEVLSSNGSTSMGSVCGSTLALMDAGVPISKPVSGVAMGLIKEGDEVRILTDIQGIEDFLGDMDFKVAGTDTGITALQMDMKITSISMDTVRAAVMQAKTGRAHIMGKMLELLSAPRPQLSPYAPRLLTIRIDPEQIGMIIGPGGKNIKGITEETGAKIDIEDDGTVMISSMSGEGALKAKRIIENMTRRVGSGDVYLGKVTRIIPIGAFVEFLPGKEGMVHISQLAEGRVGKVEDEVAVGDEVLIKIREVDNRGRFNLTRLGIHPDEAAAARAAAASAE
ncbi:polyribonucleotide nucleotidyltransferase [Pseudanabaena galeata UHCC 0370]|jgi:polyribonucleotide nucleotidyltransferase|uniref:Polyribonucleotide nucleotidyltransferase n=1 Tax=Pseudanabaena galeata UHCC 0370 TaxID=3110310 RepID=A0ABU5TMH9_9CYAN|nr:MULTISPECIES: polyribonucleotide nucleotidyltransferase [Pseudanabaena]MEA5479241.1 polyribonucleotide nucleotidyltransferase [Pseudanabaena galeata UHCC 0370]MEA5489762.1 polyribonucleotide nucleotidyltransferase [Pseudanabaena sp. CCNP1317]OYQ66294.1 polyribonucleotide nucleotidyltransferase [Pseudanabaena sp. SR411]WGS73920.1 polyribonucleotide nucleotidyltransferase [Pseudanabaena galeata CCNP1313]